MLVSHGSGFSAHRVPRAVIRSSIALAAWWASWGAFSGVRCAQVVGVLSDFSMRASRPCRTAEMLLEPVRSAEVIR